MTTFKVGIATYDEMKARTMAIARGAMRGGSATTSPCPR